MSSPDKALHMIMPRKNEELLNWSATEAAHKLMNSSQMVLEDLNSNLGNFEALQSRMKHDRMMNESQKENEFKIRSQLDMSKQVLLQTYKSREEMLFKEIAECKQHYESIILEKDKQWKELLQRKQTEITEIQLKCQETIEASAVKFRDNEQSMIQTFASQEAVWNKKIADIEEDHKRQMSALAEKHDIDSEAKQMIAKAHNEAYEAKIKQQSEKKLKKYEGQIEEIIKHYKDKELIMQGKLEEARRDMLLVQSSGTAKEQALREELQLKDNRLISIQSRLNTIDDYMKIAEVWRSIAKEVSTITIQACATVQDIPEAPEPPAETLTGNVFQGFAREDEINRKRKLYEREVENYNRLRLDHVMVSKKQLTKAMKTSKRVIERLQAEMLPKVDNIGII